MMYADFAYYQGNFGGRLIQSADVFGSLSERSADFLNMLTFGRLADSDTLKLYENKVKRCTCELVEQFFRRDYALESAEMPEISENIGAYSVSRANPYDYIREISMTEAEFGKSLKMTVFRHFSDTNLLYRGVD